jgi:hypothetical protein
MSSESQENNVTDGGLSSSLGEVPSMGGISVQDTTGINVDSTSMMTFPSASDPGAGYLYLPFPTTFPSTDMSWAGGFDPASLLALQNLGQLTTDPQQLLTSPVSLQNPQLILPTGTIMNPEMYLMNNYLVYPSISGNQTLVPSAVTLSNEQISSTLGATTGEPISTLGTAFSNMTFTTDSVPTQLVTTETAPVVMTNSVQQNGDQTVVTEDTPSTNAVTAKSDEKKASSAPDKPMSWAAVAKQPPKPTPPKPQPQPTPPAQPSTEAQPQATSKQHQQSRGANNGGKTFQPSSYASLASSSASSGKSTKKSTHDKDPMSGLITSTGNVAEIVKQLHLKNHFNPRDLSCNLSTARFFVVKSYAEDDIHRSLKYSIWTSTENGNRRLDNAYKDRKGKGDVYLFFSVNGSGHFCGIAQMLSEVDFYTITGVWAQDKWKGQFDVKWIYVKDVPNGQLRHIRLENNENKPVTNSRDTQEVPLEKGKQVFKIIHSYQATSSIFDDFEHYEEKEREQKEQGKS